jgi:hypothetical protein
MATLWKHKVFNKLKHILFTSFRALFNLEQQAKPVNEISDFFHKAKSTLLNRFVQSISDLSINEVKVHMLGSTKFVPDGPYEELESMILANTR